MTEWPSIAIRRIFRVVNGGTPTADEENWGGDVPWATPVDIGRSCGTIRRTERYLTDTGAVEGSRIVPEGSILVSTRAPIGYVARAEIPMAFNQGCRALVAHRKVDSRFFVFQLSALTQEMHQRGQGTTFLELSTDSLASMPVTVPPLEDQRRIADFLETETARIDALVNAHQRQISLLKERPWVAVVHRIAKLDRCTIPLRRVFLEIVDGPFGSAFTSSDYSDDGAGVVRLGNIGFAEYINTHMVYIPMELYSRFRRHAVLPGDLLLAGLGDAKNHAGRGCVAPISIGPMIVKGKCFRARVDLDRALPPYLAAVLSSQVGRDAIEGRGSTRSMINLDIVKSACIPIPDLKIQKSIVEEFAEMRELTDTLVERIERQVTLLSERRRALITGAVMGQLELDDSSIFDWIE